MTTSTEYALMAGASYISTRDPINRFPIPNGWTEIVAKRQALPSGFEATYFTKGTEIVISYAGTDPGDITGDIAADLALGVLGYWGQVLHSSISANIPPCQDLFASNSPAGCTT